MKDILTGPEETTMANYLLLIYRDEAATAQAAGTDVSGPYRAFLDRRAGALRGVPENPGAWLTTVARRRALDLRRRAEVADRALPKLAEPDAGGEPEPAVSADDRLRLVFTCCHPALAEQARVALTLRMVCGL